MLYPIILVISLLGAFSINKNVFDVGVCVVFGVIGWLMNKYEFAQPDPAGADRRTDVRKELRALHEHSARQLLRDLHLSDRDGVPDCRGGHDPLLHLQPEQDQ
ncbi:MAG: tripartite tricarboxylate transporter permease [Christensenellales bacterium]